MLIVGAVWLLTLGGWMVFSLFRQVREIRTFADTSAKPIVAAQPKAEEIAGLRARLAAFSEAIGKKEKATLRLSAADLNTLLATEEPLAGMKASALVEDISQEAVRLLVSLQINGVPFSGEHFWLNGTATVAPAVHKTKGILLNTQSLAVPGKTVTDGFLQHYKENGHLDTLLLAPYRKEGSAVLGLMQKLTTVRLEAGAVVAEFVP